MAAFGSRTSSRQPPSDTWVPDPSSSLSPDHPPPLSQNENDDSDRSYGPTPSRHGNANRDLCDLNDADKLDTADKWREEIDDEEWSAWIDGTDAVSLDAAAALHMSQDVPPVVGEHEWVQGSPPTKPDSSARSSNSLHDSPFTLSHISKLSHNSHDGLYSNPWGDGIPSPRSLGEGRRADSGNTWTGLHSLASSSQWEDVDSIQCQENACEGEDSYNPWNEEKYNTPRSEGHENRSVPVDSYRTADGVANQSAIEVPSVLRNPEQRGHATQRQIVAPGVLQEDHTRRERVYDMVDTRPSWMQRLCGRRKKE